jgi:hypothetical protein
MAAPFRTKERWARERRDIVRIRFRAPFSSIDRCPLEIPRLVAPLVALGRPLEGEKAHRAPRDLIAPIPGTEQIVLPGQSRGRARRAAVTTPERRVTALNDESIVRLLTRAVRRARLERMDATRRRTVVLPVSDRLDVTTAMTSTPEDREATRRDVHAPRAPAAMAGRHELRDLTVVTTATRAERALSVQLDPVRARQVRRARLARTTATATRGHLGRALSLRTDVHLAPSVVTTATLAIAVRVSRLAVPGPIRGMDRVMREPVARRVVGPIDVPAN